MANLELPPEWYQRPNIARIYDYWLDGTQHFPIDREVADKMDATHPNIRPGVQSNRLFLRRVVAHLAQQGVTQFLDIGTGLPTGGAVHTVALDMQPQAKIVYVDIDPLVVGLSQLILKEERVDTQAIAIIGDMFNPQGILEHPDLRALFDFQQPIAVLCFGLFYFVPDDEKLEHIIQALYEAMPTGSYIAFSHLDFEALPGDSAQRAVKIYENSVTKIKPRTIAEMNHVFRQFSVIDPGIVYVPLWHPVPEHQTDPFSHAPMLSSMIGGVARKTS